MPAVNRHPQAEQLSSQWHQDAAVGDERLLREQICAVEQQEQRQQLCACLRLRYSHHSNDNGRVAASPILPIKNKEDETTRHDRGCDARILRVPAHQAKDGVSDRV